VKVELPAHSQLSDAVRQLADALKDEDRKTLQVACNRLAVAVASSFDVKPPTVRVLGVRPRRETKQWVDETFGDYDFESARIRLWMRTAVLEKPTSFGTLLSTLCHELCHHLDVVCWGFPNTYHTRGFFERAAVLYHHMGQTPPRRLVWDKQSDGTFRINWPRTMRGMSTSPRTVR
jgi:hypothetical protein